MYSNDQEAFTRIQSIPKAGPAPEPEAPSTTAGGLWRAVRNAVPAAAAETAAAVVKLGTMAPEGSSASGGRTEQIGQELERSLRNVAESYGPDPMTASKAEQVVFGLTRGVGKAVGYGLTTGPLAPLGFGIDEGLTEREKLIRQGVDEATASKVGAVAGAINTVGFAIPAAGATVAKTVGLATLSGPASFVAQQAGSREILRAADYESIASSYDPTDTLGLALSAIPFGFGAWAMRAKIKGGKAAPEAPAVVNESLTTGPDAIPVEPVRAADELGVSPDIAPATADIATRSPDVVAGPVVTQEHVDAAMVKNLVDFEDGVKANPPEKFEAELWRGAVTENPNFKAWFGESAIVQEDGAPLIVYHGTSADVPSFDPAQLQAEGIHLSTDPSVANTYAVSRAMDGGRGANVMPVYVSAAKVLDVPMVTTDVIREAFAAGYTAVRRGTHIVVARPEQIKSAIGNSGRFDPTSASLTDPIPVTAKEPSANVPPPQELGTQAREAPKPEGQAQGKAAEGQADQALMQSVRTRADEVATTAPDLVVGLAEDGTPITAKDALERIRREAQNGTDDELGAIDAPLVKIAMECALRFGE